MPDNPSPSRRDAISAAALVLSSLVVGLALLEAGFRVAHVSVGTVQINRRTVRASENTRIAFELRPGSVAHAEVEYRINDQGMRNPEVAQEKPPGVRRVAVIGDSIAFGYWVSEGDAFPRQLEKLLNESGVRDVEVLNFGVPGYNLDQEIETLKTKVLDFQPDVVVDALCLNDLEDVFSYEYGLTVRRGERSQSFLGRASEFLLEHSVLFSWIEYRRAEAAARRDFARMKNPLKGGLYQETLERQRAKLDARFAEMNSLLAPRKIPAVVAVFPVFGNRFANYPHEDLHQAVVRSATAAGLIGVDLLDCFKPYEFWDVRVDVIHPSPLGHRIAAHGVRDALCKGIFTCTSTPLGVAGCTGYKKEDFPVVRGY
jgi:lysophospholipase L1-like esterase